ncbi:contactin-associated protein-like 4 isoform X1 [Takifugu rubripes]|uniref:contactin-associated protein-like 4 isoform X1 n=1 Tax=Takifugu rubripes TaxID=31033 RepID=UPI001145CEB5|nr:contactin-associated protein-like 4 isoform X1 [Takifugu rubripes]
MVLVVLVLSSSFRAAGEEVCDAALVSSLPPSSFRSSSQLSGSHAPSFAKLNRRDGAGGWSPLASDRYQWLEADLGERTKVTAVATQGRYGSSDWLTSYLLMFSDTGHNWKQYRQEDSLGSFPGNSNADSVVQYKLQQPVVARFLRLIPLGWNPNGRIGLRLEAYGCPYTSDVASLDGGSSLTYSPSPALKRTFRDVVTLKFKTVRNSGMLLHAGGAGGLGLSLELERGKLQLLLRQGQASSAEPRRLASLGSLLDDQHWHRVAVERRGVHLNVTVDKHTEKVRVPAEFGHWDVQQLNVGGGPGLGPETPGRSGRNFHGCLENLLYNGHSLIDLVKQKSRQVAVAGNVTFSCDEPLSVAVTFPGPQSFLQLPGVPASSSGSFSVGFQFRTWNGAGLLLTFALPQEGGVVWLYLSEARLRLQIHKAGRVLLELSAGWALNDGQWHQAELKSRRGRLSIVVDKEERSSAHASHSLPVAIESSIFFGGCPTEGDVQGCRNPFHVFQGCMSLLTLDDQKVNLILVQQKQLGTYGNLQLDMCGVIDRCSPSPCEHGGRCTQSWTGFHCNCSDSGYSGATCHSSAYERSCEAYKHAGSTSGHFYIDVDGSGPIGPQLVYCNMTEGNTWMEVPHNNTELTRVGAAPDANQRSVYFDYAAGEEQLAAAIGQSEHCQQELSYHCRKSRLLNTPEGSPFSWWVGGPGPGRVQTYWGGAQPGSQQCACGLQGDCVDPQHYCNCDADRAEWAQDSGPLAHKESLPVRSLLLGDIQRPGSEAAYRVGPLRCHGDRNFWNAAFFDRETSYLHFPTFHGELSADISFLFKTTASSGVFLENLGIKDFIRIELSSSSQVLFSFDVGNGPLEVRVDSSVPLNDNRWHRVRAERNIKEASLQLDDLPAAMQEAPAEGHFHLQLNSQLFIGGTASRQKGFRGCIRSLQLNGVTLDLEERASITPGVQPGCPGHCSSYGSFCQNHGRCVERVNGFHCDCGLSAHAGVFCHTEVSASFKPATSVSYTFKEPYEQVRNSSAVPSSIYTDVTLRGENVTLSFRTFQSPAVLFYVSSYHREFLAVLINKHDKLEVRYKLDSSRDAEVMRSRVRHLANGRLHSVSIRRLSESVSVQIDQNPREDFNLTSDGEFNAIKSLVLGKVHGSDDLDPDLLRLGSLGFAGCLSVVRFNSISPLKAALLHPDTSPVTITGPLLRSGCGSASANPSATEDTHLLTDQSGSAGSGQPLVNAIRTDSALIGGVIAVAIFLMVAGLAIAGRFLYRRKETYRNQEVKGVKQEDGPDFPFSSQAESQDASEENPKEYFI